MCVDTAIVWLHCIVASMAVLLNKEIRFKYVFNLTKYITAMQVKTTVKCSPVGFSNVLYILYTKITA